MCSTKGPAIKAWVHRDRKVSKPIVNQSINQLEVHTPTRYRGEDVQLHVVLNSALDGGEWSASGPGSFVPPPPIDEEDRWVQQSVWMFWRREIDIFLTGILNPFK